MLGNLIGGFVAVIVGVSLVPTIATQVAVARCNDNISCSWFNGSGGAAPYAITGLITLFFALGVASAGIAVAAQGLKEAGVLGI